MTAPTNRPDPDADVSNLAALGEPVRLALYKFVVAQPDAVNRDQAAVGIGVPRHVAKFHLDKLEEHGLLEVEYRRPPGRSGPGAGRPAKHYRRADRTISVNLPERRYDLAGHVLARAITAAAATGEPVADALRTAATAAGRALAHDVTRAANARAGRAARAQGVRDALSVTGYEPRDEAARITLANCPFHSLARDYTALVCSMNVDLIDGLLDELGATGLQARLDPSPGRCCVVIGRRR